MMLAMTVTAVCGWRRQIFQRPPTCHSHPEEYCCRLHREWSERVVAGKFPVVECSRCGHQDLRIAGPDWAICQACGHQTDRPDLPPGALTPRNMSRDMSETRKRLAITDRRWRM